MKYLIGVAILLLIAVILLSRPEDGSRKITSNGMILSFGDSLTAGHGASPSESYPAILSQLTGRKVINAGVRGETSSEGLKRLPAFLQKNNVSLLILCHGGNDILKRLSRAQLQENLEEMISLAHRREIPVLLIGVPDLTLFGLSTLSLYEEIAEEKNIWFMESLLEETLSHPSLKSDQIHPNADGYRYMAEKIYEKLKNTGAL